MSTLRHRGSILAGLACIAATTSFASAVVITPIVALVPSGSIQITGVNNQNIVIGSSVASNNWNHMVISNYTYGSAPTTDLQAGQTVIATPSTISSNGIIGGFGSNGTFLYSGGNFTILNLSAGAQVYSINSSGTIVGTTGAGSNGYYMTSDGTVHIFPRTALSASSNRANLTSINDSGIAVGYAADDSNQGHLIKYDTNAGTYVDLGLYPDADGSSATTGEFINNAGLIAGSSYLYSTGFTVQAWEYTGGAYVALNPLADGDQTLVNGMDSLGDIIGTDTDANNVSHPVIWLAGSTTATDLSTLLPSGSSGWKLTSVTGINDNKLIVGMGTLNGVTEGYVFDLNPAPVPEPASLSLLATGGMLLLRRRR